MSRTKTLILPAEIASRELDARLLHGVLALERGWRVIVGSKALLNRAIWRFPAGLYLCQTPTHKRLPMLKLLDRLGHVAFGWDDDGLIYSTATSISCAGSRAEPRAAVRPGRLRVGQRRPSRSAFDGAWPQAPAVRQRAFRFAAAGAAGASRSGRVSRRTAGPSARSRAPNVKLAREISTNIFELSFKRR